MTKYLQLFIGDVAWGGLDYLILDLPPGTGDTQLTLAHNFPLTGAARVTTPQDVSLKIARRRARMFEEVEVPLLGVVENMSGFCCPNCGTVTDIFRKGGGERLAEALGAPSSAQRRLTPRWSIAVTMARPTRARGRQRRCRRLSFHIRRPRDAADPAFGCRRLSSGRGEALAFARKAPRRMPTAGRHSRSPSSGATRGPSASFGPTARARASTCATCGSAALRGVCGRDERLPRLDPATVPFTSSELGYGRRNCDRRRLHRRRQHRHLQLRAAARDGAGRDRGCLTWRRCSTRARPSAPLRRLAPRPARRPLHAGAGADPRTATLPRRRRRRGRAARRALFAVAGVRAVQIADGVVTVTRAAKYRGRGSGPDRGSDPCRAYP